MHTNNLSKLQKNMRKLFMILLLFSIFLGIYHFFSTSASTIYRPNIDQIQAKVVIERLDEKLFAVKSKSEVANLLQAFPLFLAQFLATKDPAAIIDQLHAMSQDAAMQELYKEVHATFPDLSQLEQQLSTAFRYIKFYYPSFKVPQVITLITGMGTDLYVSSDLIVISLDFFLGENATYHPHHLPRYLLRTYQPDYIAPKIISLLANQFVTVNENDHTLLQEMIYAGKVYYFTHFLLPDLPEEMVLGYTKQQWKATDEHKHFVWAHFIDKALFYEKNHMIKKKYLGDRPFTAEIGPECPGNIGGWLGYQLVKSYMQHNKTITLPLLMQEPNAQIIFSKAHYRSKK